MTLFKVEKDVLIFKKKSIRIGDIRFFKIEKRRSVVFGFFCVFIGLFIIVAGIIESLLYPFKSTGLFLDVQSGALVHYIFILVVGTLGIISLRGSYHLVLKGKQGETFETKVARKEKAEVEKTLDEIIETTEN